MQLYNNPFWVTVTAPTKPILAEIQIPGSKSISNRLLIIQQLCESKFKIENLSISDDTKFLESLLESDFEIQNCGAGGTTFRFLLALRALQGKTVILSGSKEFKLRPISPLVDALNELGASIDYLKNNGFAPIRLNASKIHGGKIKIDSNISSQFVSALMLIAPYLKGGLEISFSENPVSFSYIEMTASIMKEFSVDVEFENNKINIPQGEYISKDYSCSPDWTSASYWYGIIACSIDSQINLVNLAKDKFQGDVILKIWMTLFGVKSVKDGDDILISNVNSEINTTINIDFTNNPDLSLALTVVAAVKGIPVHFTGLSTLKVKETDRLLALKMELEKTGVNILVDENSLKLFGIVDNEKISNTTFNTYEDHRIAMALSILATTLSPVKMENPDVVSKSYPNYFEELKNIGFEILYE